MRRKISCLNTLAGVLKVQSLQLNDFKLTSNVFFLNYLCSAFKCSVIIVDLNVNVNAEEA